MLIDILKVVAGVGSFFGVCGVIAAFYYSLASRRAERSIVAVVSGEGIDEAEDVAKILAQFSDGETRLKALQELRGWGIDRSTAVLNKVKPNVDALQLTIQENAHRQRILWRSGAVLLFIGMMGLVSILIGPPPSAGSKKADELLAKGYKLKLSGKNDQAREAFIQARTLYQQLGNRRGESDVLRGLGNLEVALGRYDQAREAFIQARPVVEQLRERLGEADVLRGLGDLERHLSRDDQARDMYSQARTLYQQLGERRGEADVLVGLGELEQQLHRRTLAMQDFYEASELYDAIGRTQDAERARAAAQR